MEIRYGNGTTEYGPGVSIDLDGDEVALAIMAHLTCHNLHIGGPRTITVNGGLCKHGHVYVDPLGRVNHNGVEFSGRGPTKSEP